MELTITGKIEQSIIKRYRKEIWRPFIKAINEFDMIKRGDKIAVCISGGKDSNLLAKCMQELKKHGKYKFELVFLVMNPGYRTETLNQIIKNCELLGIPATIFQTQIFDIAFSAGGSPCYLCARMRRGHLYKKAQELGCNKIALGHHFDDVIETTLMSMLYSAEMKTMMPKIKSLNFEGMELIRPLYYVRENAIINFKNYNNLEFIRCACRFTECSTNEKDMGKRMAVKHLIQDLKKSNPLVEINIFRSAFNVNCGTVIGHTRHGKHTPFLTYYKQTKRTQTSNESDE